MRYGRRSTKIKPSDLDAVNNPVDGYLASFDGDTQKFKWILSSGSLARFWERIDGSLQPKETLVGSEQGLFELDSNYDLSPIGIALDEDFELDVNGDVMPKNI